MDTHWERVKPYAGLDNESVVGLLRRAGFRGGLRYAELIRCGLRNTNFALTLDDSSRYLLRAYGAGDYWWIKEEALYRAIPECVDRPRLVCMLPPDESFGHAVGIFEWIDGVTLDKVRYADKCVYGALGERLAILHGCRRYEGIGFLDSGLGVGVALPPLADWYPMFLTDTVVSKLGPDLHGVLLEYLGRYRSLMDAIDGEAVLVHNDFRPINTMLGRNGRICVIDWEGAMAGHACGDIGQFLRFREQVPPEAERCFVDAYNANSHRPLPSDYRLRARLRDLVNLLQMLGGEALPNKDADLVSLIRGTVDEG